MWLILWLEFLQSPNWASILVIDPVPWNNACLILSLYNSCIVFLDGKNQEDDGYRFVEHHTYVLYLKIMLFLLKKDFCSYFVVVTM